MSEDQVKSIRIVCDKAAAHKSGKPQHIDVWDRHTGTWRSRNQQAKIKKEGPQNNRVIPNWYVRNNSPTEFDAEYYYLLRCPRDRCKHDVIKAREETLDAALTRLARQGHAEVSLDQLRDTLSHAALFERINSDLDDALAGGTFAEAFADWFGETRH